MKVFPLSLADDARQWWINEGEGKITTWEELVEKFFCKFYPESYDGEEEMLDEGNNWGIDPLEFISRVNSSFKNHRRVDGRTKKIDPDLLTKDIEGFKTYEEFKNDWIYEWNKDVPWVHGKPWMDYGAWKEPTPVTHSYIIGNSLHYQDYEWYEALEDEELKEKALRNKAIMEGIKDDDESIDERQEICSNETHELPVCNIRRFEMIKYSFGDDEEYVVVKEDEYDDLTNTSEDACRAYQEIFCIMDEGWTVTRDE
ncbi:hypothetical protein Tco_1250923 [Tanacetum coccineum]